MLKGLLVVAWIGVFAGCGGGEDLAGDHATGRTASGGVGRADSKGHGMGGQHGSWISPVQWLQPQPGSAVVADQARV